jgi:hypothetical protein
VPKVEASRLIASGERSQRFEKVSMPSHEEHILRILGEATEPQQASEKST